MADLPVKPKLKMTLDEVTARFFHCRDQVHMWHFQTALYAEHIALGKFYEEFLEQADEIVECWQGHSGVRVKISTPSQLGNYNGSKEVIAYIKAEMAYIMEVRKNCPYPEVQNLLDAMTATCSRTLYLLSLE